MSSLFLGRFLVFLQLKLAFQFFQSSVAAVSKKHFVIVLDVLDSQFVVDGLQARPASAHRELRAAPVGEVAAADVPIELVAAVNHLLSRHFIIGGAALCNGGEKPVETN